MKRKEFDEDERNLSVKTLMILQLVFCVGTISSLSMAAENAEDTAEVPQMLRFYIGTYTSGESKGIYLSTLDRETGKLAEPTLVGETDNPSFLAIHPSGKYLYAVGEISGFDGQRSGAVTAWKIDQETGQLNFLGEDPSGGPGPCHLTVDNSGRTVLVANYGGGSISSRELFYNGKLGNQVSFYQHVGSSVNPQRQREPHAHSINLDPENQYAFVADLGLDQILVYRFESIDGELKPNERFPYAKVKPGSGPRHFSFHPNGQFAYVINELNSTITAFRYESERGGLEEIQTISTLPSDFEGNSYTAEVVVHPDGKTVYGSNRGHDSIAVYRCHPETGQLELLQIEPTQGKTPRNFVIDPTGTYLLAENQGSDTVVVFRIDPESGRLSDTDHKLDVPSPVCIRFAKWGVEADIEEEEAEEQADE